MPFEYKFTSACLNYYTLSSILNGGNDTFLANKVLLKKLGEVVQINNKKNNKNV